jgi:hypothetical protein
MLKKSQRYRRYLILCAIESYESVPSEIMSKTLMQNSGFIFF